MNFVGSQGFRVFFFKKKTLLGLNLQYNPCSKTPEASGCSWRAVVRWVCVRKPVSAKMREGWSWASALSYCLFPSFPVSFLLSNHIQTPQLYMAQNPSPWGFEDRCPNLWKRFFYMKKKTNKWLPFATKLTRDSDTTKENKRKERMSYSNSITVLRVQSSDRGDFWAWLVEILIPLFRSITMSCGTDSIMRNIPHIQIECGEYSAEFHQSQRTLLWIWIMLCSCLQVQPIICWHPSVFRYSFGAYSINSSKTIGNSPEVSNFNRWFLKLNWFICN